MSRRDSKQGLAQRVSADKFKYQFLPARGVSQQTMEIYKVRTAISEADGEISHLDAAYENGRHLLKDLREKAFMWAGEKTLEEGGSMFGLELFPPASAKAITICEGFLDAMSGFEMFGRKFPFVAVNSVSSAKSECAENFERINSFDKIYLCFDNDPPGQEATKKVARLFDFNKVYIVPLQKKDVNEYLEAGEIEEFKKIWWSSRRFLPEGVLSTYAEYDKVIDDDIEKPSIPYPFPRLQSMTYGIRTGELVLLTAQEGIGKTEIFRALEYNILKNTRDNIGIIHLEENKARTVKGLVGYEVKKPIHLPDFAIPKEDIKKTFREVTGRDERVHIYSHFGSDDPNVILDTVRFLAGSCNCKYIFLDHITMVVTGLAGEDERRALDYISTRLAMMVEELDFSLFLISHVNDEGQTRGSRNISKVAHLRIDLHRDIEATNERERNTTSLTISKNRFAGKAGPAGLLYFNPDTYTLEEEDPDALPF